MQGNQWLISPDHKAGYFWWGMLRGGWLTSHDVRLVFDVRYFIGSHFEGLLGVDQISRVPSQGPKKLEYLPT